MGNSTGLVFTMRTTLPDPGVSRMQKNGRSQPSSVYSSMTWAVSLRLDNHQMKYSLHTRVSLFLNRVLPYFRSN